MDRNFVVLIVVSLFAISVIAVGASSLNSANIESGFGIESRSGNVSNPNVSQSDSGSQGGDSSPGREESGLFGEMTGMEDSGDTNANPATSLVILTVMVSVAAGSVALVFWMTDGDVSASSVPLSSTEETTPDTEQTKPHDPIVKDPENAVYQAWWNMVQHAGVARSQSRTPAEYATAAIDAGMDPETVSELTALFRMVRYGDHSPTDDIEQRASIALVQIQSQAPDESQGDTNS